MDYNKTSVSPKISVNNIITLHRASFGVPRDKVGEAHDFPELMYVASGDNTVLLDGVPHLVKEGEAMIYAPLTHHIGSEQNRDITLYIVSFETLSPLPDSLYNKAITLTKKQTGILSEIFSKGLERFSIMPPESGTRGMFFNGKGDEAILQVIKNNLELLLLSLIDSAADDTPAEEKMRVIEYMRSHISKELTLETISRGCSMSTSRLKRMFQGGVINYFNDLKISRAKELIRNTDMNYSQIAESLGFSSLHYFSRLFKAKTGSSPSAFRKRIR